MTSEADTIGRLWLALRKATNWVGHGEIGHLFRKDGEEYKLAEDPHCSRCNLEKVLRETQEGK